MTNKQFINNRVHDLLHVGAKFFASCFVRQKFAHFFGIKKYVNQLRIIADDVAAVKRMI